MLEERQRRVAVVRGERRDAQRDRLVADHDRQREARPQHARETGVVRTRTGGLPHAQCLVLRQKIQPVGACPAIGMVEGGEAQGLWFARFLGLQTERSHAAGQLRPVGREGIWHELGAGRVGEGADEPVGEMREQQDQGHERQPAGRAGNRCGAGQRHQQVGPQREHPARRATGLQ